MLIFLIEGFERCFLSFWGGLLPFWVRRAFYHPARSQKVALPMRGCLNNYLITPQVIVVGLGDKLWELWMYFLLFLPNSCSRHSWPLLFSLLSSSPLLLWCVVVVGIALLSIFARVCTCVYIYTPVGATANLHASFLCYDSVPWCLLDAFDLFTCACVWSTPRFCVCDPLSVGAAVSLLRGCIPPSSVFLLSGSAGGQAVHHAGQRRAAPELPGQAEETLRRGDL